MTDAALTRLGARVGSALTRAHLRVVTAESCTAGWIAKALTDTPGSSEWFDGAYVTYSNASKQRALGVSGRTLERFGAVSEPTVREMARGALRASAAQVAIAVTGIAGPDGATPGKPVGTVWFCVGRRRGRSIALVTAIKRFSGGRQSVRRKAVEHALWLILRHLA
jgi:nicotinamide-nucleotide amidase